MTKTIAKSEKGPQALEDFITVVNSLREYMWQMGTIIKEKNPRKYWKDNRDKVDTMTCYGSNICRNLYDLKTLNSIEAEFEKTIVF